ncbi:MAG: SDR family NAD(P)-dependent oxidoreductase [Thermaerobacter sp.]|nr:SDR family NAD(P)-dependent oxidoreductase [Thermaerobacter sp.]
MTEPPQELAGRHAIVTGGARGIGLAVARALGSRGAKIVLADAGLDPTGRPEDPSVAANAAAALRAEGIEAVPFVEALSTAETAERLVAFATERLGPVDILVNNAAVLQDRMVWNLTMAAWDEVLAVNLSSAFYLLRQVAPGMRERRWGRVINMVSSAGLIGNTGQANYAAAKGGLAALSRVAALDLARYGVTVNAVAPFAHTRITDLIVPRHPAVAEYLTTVRGVASPDSVGQLAAYLATEEAKVYTGQVFGVRGGEVFLFSAPRPVGVQRYANSTPTAENLAAAFARWEEQGLLTPLETDLEYMSRPLATDE